MGPDGHLYYIAVATHELRRIRYSGGTGPGSCPVGQYKAEYFNNSLLSGAPALTRCEQAIAYDWGTGAPAVGINADNFSVRWIGRHSFAAGAYNFTAVSDNGMRVWFDGALMVDKWQNSPTATYTASRN